MNGDSLDDDVGLHFNPRRNQEEVVLNNRVDGSWLEEEIEPIPRVFQELLPFEVKIVVKKNKFKVRAIHSSAGNQMLLVGAWDKVKLSHLGSVAPDIDCHFHVEVPALDLI